MSLEHLAALGFLQVVLGLALAALLARLYFRLSREEHLRYWACYWLTHSAYLTLALLVPAAFRLDPTAAEARIVTLSGVLLSWLEPAWMLLAAGTLRRGRLAARHVVAACAAALAVGLAILLLGLMGQADPATTTARIVPPRYFAAAIAISWFALAFARHQAAAARSLGGALTLGACALYALHYALIGLRTAGFPVYWSIENPIPSVLSAVLGVGTAVGIALSVVDSAAASRLALHRSEQRLQLAIDGSAGAIYDWDLGAGTGYLSPQYYLMLGEEPGAFEPRGELISQSVHPDDVAQLRRTFLEGIRSADGRFELEYRIRHRSGTYLWVLSRGRVTERDGAGNPVRVAGTLGDITARKEAEAELARTTELAQSAAHAKSAFLANMSHEIRTPVSAILGLTALLRDSNLPADAAEIVRLIEHSGDSLLHTINGILDLSKIEAGKVEISAAPADLVDCADTLVRIVAPSAAAKALDLRLHCDPAVPRSLHADASRFRQVLLNLLSNALKFTEKGGVAVTLDGTQPAPGRWDLRCSVTDTGPGIAPEAIGGLFQPFHQLDDSASRAHQGTGLGLAICRRLVEMMGGSIWAESDGRTGATFTFTLPLALADPSGLPESSLRPPSAWPDVRVLVAEDNAVNRLIAQRLLEKLGIRSDLAVTGDEAVQMALSSAYDLVLMDVQMPGLDGLEASRRIRAARGAKPVIIALTAHVLEQHRAACLNAGMNGFLTKPLDLAALSAILTQWIPPGGPPGVSAS